MSTEVNIQTTQTIPTTTNPNDDTGTGSKKSRQRHTDGIRGCRRGVEKVKVDFCWVCLLILGGHTDTYGRG